MKSVDEFAIRSKIFLFATGTSGISSVIFLLLLKLALFLSQELFKKMKSIHRKEIFPVLYRSTSNFLW